ncbi:MAG TPA: DDE-type integrase/transposase/recombinase [Pseudosphingobacterium sp.]|nr:DDE-type integrase/transposase/recombinase [Pseudosphingobacterium sp.]
MGIKSIVRKKHRITTTDSGHAFTVNENILARDFNATGTGQKWVSDITYIPTGKRWLYLTAIMDLADRKIIGWSMNDTLAAEDTVIPAFNMALARRQMEQGLIFHSDRGIQYACNRFRH